jgi:hypothetical protein
MGERGRVLRDGSPAAVPCGPLLMTLLRSDPPMKGVGTTAASGHPAARQVPFSLAVESVSNLLPGRGHPARAFRSSTASDSGSAAAPLLGLQSLSLPNGTESRA